MTEASKQILLDYMLGKLSSEEEKEGVVFPDNFSKQNNLESKLEEEVTVTVDGEDSHSFTIRGCVQDTQSNNFVVYGIKNIIANSSTEVEIYRFGFICILNVNFEVVKVFDSFSTGTNFRDILCLYCDEDGNYYGLDTNELYMQGMIETPLNPRLILLNNFTNSLLVDKGIVLRNSYYFPTEYDVTFLDYAKIMKKGYGTANYSFFVNSANNNKGAVITLRINVGSENEWKIYYVNQSSDIVSYDYLIEWNSEGDPSINLFLSTQLETSKYRIAKYSLVGESMELQNYLDDNSAFTQLLMLSSNLCYLIISENDETRLGYYDTSAVNIISDHLEGNPEIYNCNNIIFVNRHFRDYDDLFYYYYSGIVINNKLYESSKKQFDRGFTFHFFVLNAFDLYSLYIQTGNFIECQPLVFDSNQYNGEAIVNKNSLVPKIGQLYSQDGLVFARSIYNKTINNNATTSTIEIPNNYLNDISIVQKDLLSQNNNVINSNHDTTVKNVYENVFLNFTNVISIVDRNEGYDKINSAASRVLNYSINNPENYESNSLTKVKINYTNGSSEIREVNLTQNLDDSYQITFDIYFSTAVNSIELVSSDEKTSYLTIDCSNYQSEKYYKFNQKVEVV